MHLIVAVQLDFGHSQCFANRTRQQSRLVRFATLSSMHEEMCIISIIMTIFFFYNLQLRARRALTLFNDVLLRTRRALMQSDIILLSLKGTPLHSINALLVLKWCNGTMCCRSLMSCTIALANFLGDLFTRLLSKHAFSIIITLGLHHNAKVCEPISQVRCYFVLLWARHMITGSDIIPSTEYCWIYIIDLPIRLKSKQCIISRYKIHVCVCLLFI